MPNLSYFLKWVAQHGAEAGFCAKTGKVVLFASLLATSQPSDGSNFEDDNKADNDDNDDDDDEVIVKSLIFLKFLHNLLTELHWSKTEVNEAKFLANATAKHLLSAFPPPHILLLVLFFLHFLLIPFLLLFLLNC